MKERVLAVDTLRGMTICLMILVNTPGSWNYLYAPLRHAEWHGFALPDLVFPGFLFSVGLSMALSFSRKTEVTTGSQLTQVFRRSILIFIVGLLMNWFPFYYKHISDLRVFGVLQRIAMSYLLAGVLAVLLQRKGHLAVAALLLLLLHYVILVAFGGADPFSLSGNVSGAVDLLFLNPSQVYRGFGLPFDPEGLLGSSGGASQVLIGYLIGSGYLIKGLKPTTVRSLLLLGIVLLGLGLAVGVHYPINKPLWTGSYVLFSSGILIAFLACLVQVVDGWSKDQWTFFFRVFGLNPLASFVASVLLVKIMIITLKFHGSNAYAVAYKTFFQPLFGDYPGSFLFAVVYTFLIWLMALALYQRKIIIKL